VDADLDSAEDEGWSVDAASLDWTELLEGASGDFVDESPQATKIKAAATPTAAVKV
jgi:hypothetical protein